MKKISSVVTIVLLLGGLVLAGCEGPLAAPGKAAPGGNTGSVSVSFTEGQARTAFPEKKFAVYKFFFTKQGGTEAEKSPGAGNTFSLEAGNWELRVAAYAQSGDAAYAASGGASFAVQGGQNNPVTVKLSPVVSSGEGSFKLAKVIFTGLDAGVTPSKLQYSMQKLAGADTLTVVGESYEFSPTTAVTLELDAGYYLLTARFGIASGEAGLTEIIHIYRNLTTEYSIVFDKADFSLVRVAGVAITGGNDSPLVLDLNDNNTAQIIAAASPPNASNPSLMWESSNPSVATVDQNGNITAVGGGTAVITVTSWDGGKEARRDIRVLSNDVSIFGITVNGSPANAAANVYAIVVPYETTSVTIAGSPRGGASAAYSANAVDFGTNNVFPVEAGENPFSIKITAEDGRTSQVYTLVVTRSPSGIIEVETVELTEIPASPLFVGDAVVFKAAVTPANATNKTLTWTLPASNILSKVGDSADSLFVTVAAKGAGTVTVSANNGKFAECTVTAIQKVAFISIDPVALPVLVAGKTGEDRIELIANVQPATASNTAVNWKSSDSTVATVNQQGVVVAVGAGTATITATAADGYGAAGEKTISVRAMYSDTGIEQLTVNGSAVSPKADGNYAVTVANGIATAAVAVALPAGKCSSAAYTASMNLAIGDNTISIVVTAENGTAKTYTLTVHRQKIAVTGISLPEIPQKLKGTEFEVTAGITPTTATYQDLSWEVSGGLTIVSQNGLTARIAAVSAGTYTITVRSVDDTGIAAARTVTVYTQGGAGFTFQWDGQDTVINNNQPVSVSKGEKITIQVLTVEGKNFTTYQWYQGANLIPGAVNSSFEFDATPVSMATGDYRIGVLVDSKYYGDVIVTVTE